MLRSFIVKSSYCSIQDNLYNNYVVKDIQFTTGFSVYACAQFRTRSSLLLERCCLYAVSMASEKLIDAYRDGSLATIRDLTEFNEVYPNTVTDNDGLTPLHYACA